MRRAWRTSMEPIYVGIHPQGEVTRILAMSGEMSLLKARLASQPSSPLALPSLLEALWLWQGKQVHAALVVDALPRRCESSLYRDMFPDFGNEHYSLEYVRRPPRRREAIRRQGDFR